MIDRVVGGVSKLAEDAGVLLLAPLFFLCFGLGNAMLPQNRRDSEFRVRLVLALGVLFFLFAIFTVIIQDRAILIVIWKENPILFSFLYSACGILLFLAISTLIHWKLRPSLWRRTHRKFEG